MAKEDIFSKINLKDYNNILENILEQKDFSEDTKNLLLSMLYKIENGYQDYETVKVNVSTKKYFLKKIVQIIKEECKEIKIIKPLTQESKILEKQKLNYIVDKEKGTIIVYPNEMDLVRIQARCLVENIGSSRVMEKAGMQFEGVIRKGMFVKGKHQDLKMYAILREDF